MSATSIAHWLSYDGNVSYITDMLSAVGVDEVKIRKLRDPYPWSPDEAVECSNTMRQIIYGAARMSHYEDIHIPVQMTAKFIAEFVHPFNWVTICHLFKPQYLRSELKGIDERVTPIDPVDPRKLVAYVEEWAGLDRDWETQTQQ